MVITKTLTLCDSCAPIEHEGIHILDTPKPSILT